jgi:adenine-specific DNA methylase
MDRFEPRGVTDRCNAEEKRWDFCPGSMVEAASRRLFERINSEYLLFLYNIEDLLSKEELLGLFEEYCTSLSFAQIKFRWFRADIDCESRDYKTEYTRELLDLGRPKR